MTTVLEITYSRSAIGRSGRQRRTLEALGLRRLHDTVRHQDGESIRGMVNKVAHLVTWREIDEGESR
ncbi:MAG: 50S ribosomal protein L30 [Chloroflexota bacterium]